MNKSEYIPRPSDTSNISLPEGMETLVEALARNVHEVWAAGRLEDGWVLGEERNDALKQHPCLVPYEELSEEEEAVFEEGYKIVNETQRKEWAEAVAAAKEKAANEQKVQFIYPDLAPFKEACMPLHESVLAKNKAIQPIYDKIQEYNEKYPSVAE